ncbi:MAG: hypothetical protein J1G06_08425 [Oscillospiraceae bacterium]|nr:hypothetical protein [Oscillospiraceae bacterium]
MINNASIETNNLSKEESYKALIEKVKKSYPPKLVWCDECKDEINLWSYWQGSLNPDILLVGQDWGNPFTDKGKDVIRMVKCGEMNESNAPSDTDRNLSRLFKESLDIDIWKKSDRLFFTNLALGYRTGNESGGSYNKYLNKDKDHFKELVSILRPKVVICLGKDTYVYALKAYDKKITFPKGFNYALDNKDNTEDIDGIRFFGMAHCGSLGILNRCRYGNKKTNVSAAAGLDLQIKDWKEVNSYLKSL